MNPWIDDAPPMLRVVHLRDCGLEPDVVTAAFSQCDGESGDRFHREGVGGHHRDLLRNGFMLANGRAPLHALLRPGARGEERCLAATGHARRQRETTSVQRNQRELEPLPFSPQNVLARNLHIRESNHAVLDRLEAHEPAAMHDLDAWPTGLDDERGNLFPRLSVHDGVWCACHHEEQLGARAIRAPELFAAENEVFAVGRWRGGGVHVRRIRTGIYLGERERADGALGQTREVLPLLLLGAEKLERLWETDGLMRRQQRGQ